jgi:exoribonuclease R
MFPHQLAADLLSLGPNTCALSFGCILHTSEEEDGKLKAEELVVCCSTVNVERLTYDEVIYG